MRVLLLLARVPVPAECARSAVDSTWVLRLADQHDVLVAVDENTAGASELRDAGLTVHVSDKRHVYMPGDERVDADTAFASWVTARHAERPIDLVVAASERPAFGPVRDALHDVAWTVLAGDGPTALARRFAMDTEWLQQFGHELWHAASHVAAADAVISPVAPRLLGLDTGTTPVRTLLPVPTPQLTDRVTGELVTVLATGVTTADATTTLAGALAAVDIHPATTVVVVHSAAGVGATDVAPALAAAVPARFDRQVVLAPADRHGGAGAWVAAADTLVLADAAELLIPAVARRAALIPTVLADPAANDNDLIDELLATPPPRRPRGGVELLPWTTPARVAAELRALQRSPEPDVVIVHDDDATGEATRWLDLTAIDRFDVVLGSTPRPPWGMPHPTRLDDGLVALHRRTWHAVATDLGRITSLAGLVAHVGDLAGARSHTLGSLTVQRDEATTTSPAATGAPLGLGGGPLPTLRAPVPARSTPAAAPARAAATATEPDTPTAAAPGEALRQWARTARWPERARLALPWSMGLAEAIREDALPDGVAGWARSHTITARARLLLPWKWGLLPRAMEDHW